MKVVAVSGGFDPVHVGHLRMFHEAAELGDALVVIANNDNWLRAKKGYAFMPERERRELLLSLGPVDAVHITDHAVDPDDMTVCEALRAVHPDVFANGGDRKEGSVPEYALCDELGIEMAFNVGGDKIQSSSELVEAAALAAKPKAVT